MTYSDFEPSAQPGGAGGPENSAALGLLMDVELPLVLRFGKARLALRDLLELKAGSAIELERDPENPVEILVSGKVIARGEAVVVEGHYGVRISEVVSSKEPLLPLPGKAPAAFMEAGDQ